MSCFLLLAMKNALALVSCLWLPASSWLFEARNSSDPSALYRTRSCSRDILACVLSNFRMLDVLRRTWRCEPMRALEASGTAYLDPTFATCRATATWALIDHSKWRVLRLFVVECRQQWWLWERRCGDLCLSGVISRPYESAMQAITTADPQPQSFA